MSTRYDDDDYLAGFDQCVRCKGVVCVANMTSDNMCFNCSIKEAMLDRFRDSYEKTMLELCSAMLEVNKEMKDE
jgi:hypothetical protein